MSSRSRPYSALLVIFFLAGVAAQSARLFAPFGANVNFFMAGLPALAFAASTSAYAFTALAAIVLLKTIPAFEFASLAFTAAAALIFFARRLPLHPFILNPALSVIASAAFYAALDTTFFSARGIMLTEFFTTALISFMFTLPASYVTRK